MDNPACQMTYLTIGHLEGLSPYTALYMYIQSLLGLERESIESLSGVGGKTSKPGEGILGGWPVEVDI